jgi:hypothetical protein
VTRAQGSLAALRALFAGAPAALEAVRPLSPSARVGLELDEGPAGFAISGGAPALTQGAPDRPDFTLRLPARAVARLCASPVAGVGELGLIFFSLLLERDPALRVGVRVQAPTTRLLANGYLGVLLLGGPRVALWLLRRGLADPRAVIERLRRRPR